MSLAEEGVWFKCSSRCNLLGIHHPRTTKTILLENLEKLQMLRLNTHRKSLHVKITRLDNNLFLMNN